MEEESNIIFSFYWK